jgi:Flp pilus assembly protein CpaB
VGRIRSSVPRSRLPLHRRPLADPAALRRWLVVLALAAATGLAVSRTLSAAEAARQRWGRTRTVVVATRPLATGDALAGATRTVAWPEGLLPDAAVREVPPGARAAGPIDGGAPLTRGLLATGDDDGRRRVALPVGSAPLPVRPGDRVDVWATTDPSLGGGTLATRRLAVGAEVTSAGDAAVVVAVAPDEVPDLAEAAALATVTLVAVG